MSLTSRSWGLRRGAQRPGLPGAAAGAPAPAAPGTPPGEPVRGAAGGPSPADEGGLGVPSGTAHEPGGPRRHPGPALLRRLRVRAGRRAARAAIEGRAVRPPPAGPPASEVPGVRRPGRLPRRVRRGDARRGGDQPPRHARRRKPRPVAAPGQVAPVAGPRLQAKPHVGGSADGPVRPPGADTGRAGGPHPGMAKGALRVRPVAPLQARPHHVPGGGDRPGGRDPPARRGAAGPGAPVSCLPVHHPALQGREIPQGDDPAGQGPFRRHPGQARPPGLPPEGGDAFDAVAYG